MAHTQVAIDCAQIHDWQSFHSVFAEILGFPDFYGRNMDAWIDCLISVDEPLDGMTKIHAPAGGVLVLHLANAKDFAVRCPEQYAAIIECSSFVNYRRLGVGESPALALSFWK
jgi:Barstar (barnase inhibitor)